MADLLTLESLFTLLMLILLQAVLGFDNLLYIAIESNKVGEKDAPKVRRWGIAIAVALRIILLVVIVKLFDVMAGELFSISLGKLIQGAFTLQSLVTLFGGAFIIYTAIKEISHMLSVDDIGHSEVSGRKSVLSAIAVIVLMNLVFSFDSILSAMAIASEKAADGTTTYQVPLMAIAIILSGIAMILMADFVTDFLKKNRMYQVMGLFILFLVGVLLVTEGAHLSHLKLFGFPIEAMSKSSFYLVIGVLVVTDVISTKYQKRLWAQREAEIRRSAKMIDAKVEGAKTVDIPTAEH
ncbi:MAG: tellurium resistance protein TerC [Robiginitomaculum sp.]|nr:tellurium resistance protein TerC [Robiginitomaculum sp.]